MSTPLDILLTERDALAQRIAAGESRESLIAELEARHEAHADHDASACDDEPGYLLTLDLLDCLYGWCAPHMRL